MTHLNLRSRFLFASTALAILALFSVSFLFVKAEEGSSTPEGEAGLMRENKEERRDDAMQQAMEERRAEVASTTDVFKAEMQEHRAQMTKHTQERVYNLVSNITGRMNAAIFRLTNIADRIESRANKLEANGVKGDAVKAELTKARASLDAARTILSSDLGAFTQQDKPRERFTQVRAQLHEAGSHIRDAHRSLLAAFAALKAAVADGGTGNGVSDAVKEKATSMTHASSTNF